jgi:Tfp pilus assembly protein PilX
MRRSDNGIVLVTVIIFTVILFALAIAIVNFVFSQFKLAKHRENREAAYYLAQAGLQRAHWEFLNDTSWATTYDSYENAFSFTFPPPPESGNVIKIWAGPRGFDCDSNPTSNSSSDPCLYAHVEY